MSYWVYENWTHKRARVHRAKCSHCNDGRGVQPSDSGRNGKWYGPYDRDRAFDQAKALQQEDTAACSFCVP